MVKLTQKLADFLRASCGEVEAIQKELEDIDKKMGQLRQIRESKAGGLAHAIGSRDAFCRLLLPEGMTLQDAWESDYHGIRTGERKDKDDNDE